MLQLLPRPASRAATLLLLAGLAAPLPAAPHQQDGDSANAAPQRAGQGAEPEVAELETLGAEELDARAEEIVGLIASAVDERGATAADVRAFFREDLAEAVSEKALAQILRNMRADGDVHVERLGRRELPEGGGAGYRHHLVQETSAWCVTLALDPEGRGIGIFFGYGARHVPRAQLVRETEALGGRWGLAARLLEPAEGDGEGGTRVAEDLVHGLDEPLPLGSVFKLYVLAELARRVKPEGLDLDQELEIREEWKSLPSGELHAVPAGTKVSLRELATKMIAISDNTAADHLIHFLGRESIEKHLAEYANSVPERNTPFLTTLEMFLFKGVGPKRRGKVFPDGSLDAASLAWSEGTADERRAWLEGLLAAGLEGRTPEKLRGALFFGYSSATLTASEHRLVEWFARPRDVVELVARAERGELVDGPTSALFLDFYGEGAPQYVLPGVREQGYKGGSETGVLVLSARVAMEDGRTAILCLSLDGVSSLDPTLSARTSQVFNAWIRNLLEGDPVADEEPAETDAAGGARD